jgi:hypothetical protein
MFLTCLLIGRVPRVVAVAVATCKAFKDWEEGHWEGLAFPNRLAIRGFAAPNSQWQWQSLAMLCQALSSRGQDGMLLLKVAIKLL